VSSGAFSAGDSAIEDAAKARYSEGVKLYNKHKYEEARAAFLQAIALKKRPAAVMMLAQSALKSGRWIEAAKSFEEFVSLAGEIPPKLQRLVDEGQKEARSHIGQFHFDVPDSAEVTVDGAAVDPTKNLDVGVGTHVITVAYKDEKKQTELDVAAGKVTEVRPSFIPKPIIPKDTRTRPKEVEPPPPAATPESPSILAPPATTWPVFVLGAIGVGGLGTAAVFGGLAANASHSADVADQTIARNAKPGATCSDPDSFKDDSKGVTFDDFASTCSTRSRSQRFAESEQSVFQASLIVGLVGFAGAVTWFLIAPKEGAQSQEKPASSETPLVIPWASTSGGGLMTQGRF
jgi:hypothetical protein